MRKIIFLLMIFAGVLENSLAASHDFLTFSRGEAKHKTVELPLEFEVAPDGSEVRILGRVPPIMSSIKATFKPGMVSKAVYHKTITEIWHVLEGEGYFWRRDRETGAESCVKIKKGTTLTVPKETEFQFRATGHHPLEFFIATTPLWPGDHEAEFVPRHWKE